MLVSASSLKTKGTLTILDSVNLGSAKGWRTLYTVHCSECCKDPEMFGDGTFKMLKEVYEKGGYPCACTRTYKWTERQTVLRVSRKCAEIDFRVNEYDAWNNTKTYLKASCNRCEGAVSTQVKCFLKSKKCPHCAPRASEKSDEYYISEFKSSGKFHPGATYTRLNKRYLGARKWSYHCPACENDIYAKAGLGSGTFETTVNALRHGLPCRCSACYILSKEQQEVRIRNLFPPTIDFVRWVGDYKTMDSNFVANCSVKDHGSFSTSVHQLLERNSPCLLCASKKVYKVSSGHFYILKVVGPTGDFTGYGISCVLEDRIKCHKRNLAEYGFCIDEMEVFPMWGEEAYRLEREVMGRFTCLPQDVEGFKTEATYCHHYLDIIEHAEEFIQHLATEIKLKNVLTA